MYQNSNQLYAEGAEKAVISVLMRDPGKYVKLALAEGISEAHFHQASCKTMWLKLCELHKNGQGFDLVMMSDQMRRDGSLDSIGGPSALTELYTYIPTDAHFSHHIDSLRDRLARREAQSFASKLDQEAISCDSGEELAKSLRNASDSILALSKPKDLTKTAQEACRAFISQFEQLCSGDGMPGIATGIREIDEITGGMRPGEFWVVSGPTSGGKSVMGLQFMDSALRLGYKCGNFTLEMECQDIIARLASNHFSIDTEWLRNPKKHGQSPTKSQLTKLKASIMEISKMPLRINDEAGLTIERIETASQQWKDTEGLDFLFIDYIQLIQAAGRDSMREKYLHISRSLKQLAKKLQIPVITASQLNDDGKLAESRAIGHDADVVLRIEKEGVCVLKNRNGAKHKRLPLRLNGRHQRFETAA